MKERISKLIDLKSIITIIMVVALVLGWGFTDKVTSEQFIPLVTMILTFYFAKKGSDKNDNNV